MLAMRPIIATDLGSKMHSSGSVKWDVESSENRTVEGFEEYRVIVIVSVDVGVGVGVAITSAASRLRCRAARDVCRGDCVTKVSEWLGLLNYIIY